MSKPSLTQLLRDIRGCTLCEEALEHGIRPVLQVHPRARILIAGQAPGKRVHASGIPFDDPSGERLREWMGISSETFYDPQRIAILPMGFCYPGTGKSGDLPPRPDCADAWRGPVLERLTGIRLTLVLGTHAMDWHLEKPRGTLTETVRAWKSYGPRRMPLPHPSPRNNPWLKKNPWFSQELIPALRRRVRRALAGP